MVGRSFVKKGGWSTHTEASYRSGLEEKVGAQLANAGVNASYEGYIVEYKIPESSHKYHPDWVLPNGIIVETKGIFDADDRKKHQLIRAQHPGLDIRFVFTSSKAKLYKGSPTSYAVWCEKNGFKYADKFIPLDWIKETTKEVPKGSLQKKIKKGGAE